MLAVIQGLESDKISITEFLCQILRDPSYNNHPLVNDLLLNGAKICDLIHNTTPPPPSQNEPSVVTTWAINTSIEYFQKELRDFMQTATDWRFSATHATAQKIEDFKIENMAKSIKSDAPHIWTMFSGLLRAKTKNKPANEVNSKPNDLEEDENWGDLDGVDLGGFIDLITNDSEGSSREMHKLKRKDTLITVVSRIYYCSY
jgi:hypothetical protein